MPRIITRMFVRVKHSTFPWEFKPITQHSKICCVAPVLPRTPSRLPSSPLWGARFVRPPFVILQPAIPFLSSLRDARKGISVPGKAKGGACLHPQSPIVFLHLLTRKKKSYHNKNITAFCWCKYNTYSSVCQQKIRKLLRIFILFRFSDLADRRQIERQI